MYALDADRILRLTEIPFAHYEERASLHAELGEGLPYRVPKMLDGGELGGVTYTIEERIAGRSLDHVLADVRGARREQALTSFADAALAIGTGPFTRPWYGDLLYDPPIRTDSWSGYLIARGTANAERAGDRLRRDVAGIDDVVGGFTSEAMRLELAPRRLVHGDYFPGNVMVDDDLRVSGIIDWSFLTLSGDPLLDAAGAVIFLEVRRPWSRVDDSRLVADYLTQRVPTLEDVLPVYRIFYALDFAAYDVPENLYEWCVKTLSEQRP